MELPMLRRKRPWFAEYENKPPVPRKKCLASPKTLLDTQHLRPETSCFHPCTHKPEYLTDNKHFLDQISSWSDTDFSMKRALEHYNHRKATRDVFLDDQVNKKFLGFHCDITEECGAEEKQHSWAAIEKREEIVMYGPYYPNYNSGDHSEDVIIKQTQELLQSDEFTQDWKVYVFTMNSPCLARNTSSCMINLVQKAHEWWSVYGVRTHIGFMRCWGFKGTKENLFREVDYGQVDCINQTQDHEDYVKAANTRPDLNPLCENVSSAIKHLLRSVNLSFSMKTLVQGQDWKSYFKNMHCVFECEPDDEKKALTQKTSAMIEAAQARLSEESRSFEEHLESGNEFALDYTFGPQGSDVLHGDMGLAFQQSWQEMVQDKYAELIRGKLTDDFNQCVIQLFVTDFFECTNNFLHIGRIQLSNEDAVEKPNPLTRSQGKRL
ncbi:uncharacterized protein LOC131443377 isoform X1 [Solea solea]|uniref:uncharacterized protein LOC131443377 isoform X1 n=2 Tax=Solea solea TaxID=90069 RepID=UPI00272A6C43|nr:uncharacterized protein LOC131443377 isoform X1 [Solea solea]